MATLQHLLFYDGSCGLCDKAVRIVLEADQKKLFAFAPLDGEMASRYLKRLPPEIRYSDSLVLVENYLSASPRVTLFGKGALRIAWFLGWPWILLGWLSFLPGFLFDWAYRIVARHRRLFFSDAQCRLPKRKDTSRFLP